MDEEPIIRITFDDIEEANKLSLHCPICASAVHRYTDESSLAPVACQGCETLYHYACWQQKGPVCAMLGCDHTECRPYNEAAADVLTIDHADVANAPPLTTTRTQRLKAEQRQQTQQPQTVWQRVWNVLVRVIREATSG
ncbi:MAG TPA: hypothetical protein VLL52_15560 [Anaerolineae bacterium]|nr:hypothetical protein [Anaerolineae bacterium]